MGEPEQTKESPHRGVEGQWHNARHAETFDEKPVGKKQSWTLSVPSPKTVLHLGEWLSDPEAMGMEAKFGFPGVSLKTEKNFYLKARENAVFDVGADATFRSGKGWVQFAQTLDVAIKQKVMIASGHSLMIAAGPTDSYVSPPEAGEQLHPPTFDRGAVHSLVLGHLTKRDSFLLGHAHKELEQLLLELGQPRPETPKKHVEGWGHSLYMSLERARDLRNKLKGISKLAQTSPHLMEVPDVLFHHDQAMSDLKHFDVHRVIEPFREIEEASDLVTQGAEALADAEKDSEPTEQLKSANTLVSTIVYGLNTVERECERVKARGDKLRAGWNECTESQRASLEDWYAWSAKLMELRATFVSAVDAFAAEVLNAAAGLAAMATQKLDEPRLTLSAKAELQLSSGKELGAYAHEGFDLQSDEGGFELRTKGSIEAHSLEATKLRASGSMLLAGKTAEVAAKDVLVIGSRTSDLEVLGARVRLGALDPKSAARKKNQGDLGGEWQDQKQKPTTQLLGAATDVLTLQAGGKPPGENGLQLDDTTPAAIRLQKAGTADLWATKTIHIEANESEGTVRMNVGAFVIRITKEKVLLGQASEPGKDPSKAFLSINGEGQIALATHKGAWLKLGEEANLKSKNGNSTLDLTGSGVKVNGSKITIG